MDAAWEIDWRRHLLLQEDHTGYPSQQKGSLKREVVERIKKSEGFQGYLGSQMSELDEWM